ESLWRIDLGVHVAVILGGLSAAGRRIRRDDAVMDLRWAGVGIFPAGTGHPLAAQTSSLELVGGAARHYRFVEHRARRGVVARSGHRARLRGAAIRLSGAG